jgi:anion-transporting  ArsA/GET3 family ATPase
MSMASKPFYQIADRILGSQFLQDIAEFFMLFQTMYEGFVERARAVERLLHDKRTTFFVVTTLESAPVHEAQFFVQALRERELHLGAVVMNKVLPEYLLDAPAAASARRLCDDARAIADALPDSIGDRKAAERVLHEIGASFLNFEVVAKREAEQRAELGTTADVVATVPYFDTDIYDLRGLVQLGSTIWN